MTQLEVCAHLRVCACVLLQGLFISVSSRSSWHFVWCAERCDFKEAEARP